MKTKPLSHLPLGLCALSTAIPLLFTACDAGGGSGGGGSSMDLVEVSNGFGLLLPHQVFKADSTGNPTSELVALRTMDQLIANVTLANPILPVTEWPTQAVLPDGQAGNHYIYAQFTEALQVDSVFSSSPGSQGANGLSGALTVVAVDPSSGTTTPIAGRTFIGGRTYAGTASGSPPQLEFQQWVTLDGSTGQLVAADVNGAFPGLGFPGTASNGFSGGSILVSDATLVFVVDEDNDLSTYETFPLNRQIRLQASTAVRSTSGKPLANPILGGGTVGADTLPPEVALTPQPNSVPVTNPAFGDTDVDPSTQITISFTEPIQPLTVGPLPALAPPALSSAISVTFGPQTLQTKVPFTALPVSIYDFGTWVLTPVFAFPGSGPAFAECGTFNAVSLNVVPAQIQDLVQPSNRNTLPAASGFTTGEGPGLVNAPVAPDVIYAVRQGSSPGLSVIDLNGFGQSTGNPSFDFTYTSFPPGNSNFPNNPNLFLQGTAIRPAIFPGTCTVDGGSAGVFSLTRDSSLNTLLITNPIITSVGDVMIGQSLDLVFNNAKDTAGCKSGGGNICAINGLKLVQVSYGNAGPNTNVVPGNLPTQPVVGLANLVQGGGNPISWSPHPNPPALIFPPLCVQPYIGGQEPTSFYTIDPVINGGLGLSNLLNTGDPLGDPLFGLPPSGLLTKLQNMFFEGPDLPSQTLGGCRNYMHRQQIGHFLYMVDRARREIVVINSNRFQVLDRIPVSDPTNLAMSPNLDLLAVSNQKSDLVQFIDIDPTSGSFHTVVKNTPVGRGPRGIAWDPANEDILVCNEIDNSVSVISAHTLNVRKVVQSQLNLPFDVVITQRQNGFGFLRNVYFAWILNRNGDLAIFESGPSGLNGWGYDDVVGVAPMRFDLPKALSVDYANLGGGCWVVHENQLGSDGLPTGQVGGAISNVVIAATTFGQLTLVNANFFVNPQFRDMDIKVQASIGSDQLTGIPVDIAQDDQVNFGALSNFYGVLSNYSAGIPTAINGKSYVRLVNGVPAGAKRPRFLMAAVPNSVEGPGVVDVIDLQSSNLRFDTNPYLPGKQSIPVTGVNLVIDYWRQ